MKASASTANSSYTTSPSNTSTRNTSAKAADAKSAANSSDEKPSRLRSFWRLLKQAGSDFMQDRGPRLGAALAFYTVFALGPLLLLAVAAGSWAWGEQSARDQIVRELRGVIGSKGAYALEALLQSAQRERSNGLAAVIGIGTLLIGASGLFGQLQDALNTVWGVRLKPGSGIWAMIRERFLSFAMVLGTLFLLLVSLVVSAVLSGIANWLGQGELTGIGQLINFVASTVIITLLFALIYRYLPDARIAWRDVWMGAATTSLLFVFGKSIVGLYLGYSAVGSTYGAAGSLVVLLLWCYYAAQIFLFGAELTKAYAVQLGSGIQPTAAAELITDDQRAQEGTPREQSAE